jgi:hypothetical protein
MYHRNLLEVLYALAEPHRGFAIIGNHRRTIPSLCLGFRSSVAFRLGLFFSRRGLLDRERISAEVR